jgi:hypothetical protein
MAFIVDGQTVALTEDGRELAKVLFDEPKFRDFAIEKVDSVRKSSSKWKDYAN